MILNDLKLKNYRSYAEEVFEFGPGVNIIVGPNASGKTNLLESILTLCTGSSYRVKDMDLIAFDQPWARIESSTSDGTRVLTIEQVSVDPPTTKKKFVVNGANYARLSLQKAVPVVVFEPEHLRLLHGGPTGRRDYLDNLLEQTTPGYSTIRRDYRRTVAQRNALLKRMINPDDGQLFAWNVRLSQLGGKIVEARSALVTRLNIELEDLYRQLSHTESTVNLTYVSDAEPNNYSSEVLKLLSRNVEKDSVRGFTGNGPHRHDFEIVLNGHPAALAASRGETRTLLLALKILELRIIEAVRDKKPILLLDDVFSELDGARRKALTLFLESYQTFITTTDADIVVQHFMDNCTILPIQKTTSRPTVG